MAISVTRLTSDFNTNNAMTNTDTAAVTPTSGADVYIAVGTANATANPTVTGLSSSWTLVTDGTNDADVDEITLWRATGTITSGQVINIDLAVQDGIYWYVFEVTGHDTSSPIVAVRTASGTGTALSITMPTPESGSGTVGIFAREMTDGFTPGTGYTELPPEVQHTGPARGLVVQWRADASTLIDSTGASSVAWDGIGVELRDAGGGTSQNESGGSTATVSVTTTQSGTAAEAAQSGSTATVVAVATGAGNGAESASGGVTATVTVTATGGGSGSETTGQHESGGSTATVTVTTTGAGTATEARSGGSTATVTVTATGAGAAAEARSGGSTATVSVVATGGGGELQALSGGSTATVTVTTSGEGTATITFTPPTFEDQIHSPERILRYYRLTQSASIVRVNGTFTIIRTPRPDLLDGLENGVDYFRGGYLYDISQELYDELAVAGLTPEPTGFGLGGYGLGTYGE